jgi:hypothetical protein
MARLCERPGCSNPADVSYGFDAEHLVVWLDGFHAAQGASSGVLCRRHADAMVVPLGWMLDDRRDPAPRLFRAPAEAPTGPMIRPRVKRLRPDLAGGTVQLRLDAYHGSTDLAAAVEEAVNEAIAIGQHLDREVTVAEVIDVADIASVAEVVEVAEVAEPEPEPEPEVVVEVVVEPVVEPVIVEPVAAVEPVELDHVEADETEMLPWQPVFDETDDLKGLLKARGRLLSRAFHGVGADDH